VARPAPKPKPAARPKPASQVVVARGTVPRAVPPSRPTPAPVPAPAAAETVPFNPASMKRPTRLSGREPQLTQEAREARVQGTALVRCTVTPQGAVTRCRVLNRLQGMESELLDALSTWQVTPVLQDGKPVAVDYTFSFRF
jgi:periplasmic protein TonB